MGNIFLHGNEKNYFIIKLIKPKICIWFKIVYIPSGFKVRRLKIVKVKFSIFDVNILGPTSRVENRENQITLKK